MSVYIKLQEARMKLQNTALKKSGHNKFAGYYYFELGDFLPAIQRICSEMGLCGIVAFTSNMAYLTINDTEDGSFVTFTSPMSSAALKGCHDVQNLGAVQTYLRRYLWVNAFEIVEHDALEPLTGKEEPAKKSEAVVAKPAVATAKTEPFVASVKVGKKELPGEWILKPSGEGNDWLNGLKAGLDSMLQLAVTTDDVANIFKVNHTVFAKAKEMDSEFYAELMASFTSTKKSLIKES